LAKLSFPPTSSRFAPLTFRKITTTLHNGKAVITCSRWATVAAIKKALVLILRVTRQYAGLRTFVALIYLSQIVDRFAPFSFDHPQSLAIDVFI
jgi:hypothetical protein